MNLDKEVLITIRKPPIFPRKGFALVEPYYDSDKIGSIWMPEEAKNPQSQQGLVLASRCEGIPDGAHILYTPYDAQVLTHGGHEYLVVTDSKIIAIYTAGEVWPRSKSVVLKPEVPTSGIVAQGSIVIPQRVFDSPPVTFGSVVRIGADVDEVRPGDRVIIPPFGGYEVGLSLPNFQGVFYFIHSRDLLAVIPEG